MDSKVVKCELCGHRWKTRLVRPDSCPRCKRYDWDDATKAKGETPIEVEEVKNEGTTD